MQIVKFIFGIILAQIATYFLIILAPDELSLMGILRVGIPLLFIALIVAFWFNSIAGHHSKDAVGKVKDHFANEREKIRSNAHRAKERAVNAVRKESAKEAAKAHAKANFKVGAAFAGMLSVGALFVFAQMLTAGLLAISATVGAMGGYYWRGKRIENNRIKELEQRSDFKVIHTKPNRPKELTSKES
jgi:protein-S-isoprenylcysteine O-methyltransferase Ste14